MNVRLHFLFSMLVAVLIPHTGGAQELSPEIRQEIGKFLDATARKEVSIGHITIDSVAIKGNALQLFANMNCSYIPFRENNVAEIYQGISALLPAELTKYRLQLHTNKHCIEELIPQALRSKKDKKALVFSQEVKKPLVTKVSRPYTPTNGLQNRHIALWQSHGFYYEPKLDRWEWQRARCLQTVEDLYTQSFVLPYLVPMLENAGANVLIPRERDYQTAEIIIDNDGCLNTRSIYTEKVTDKPWMQGVGKGFAHLRPLYTDFENPFKEGTFRTIETIKKGKESVAEWIPEIPRDGQYAVYVSYHTVPNSSDDALYTVHHKGGASRFKVNQQMGGGTWIYLGTFGFDAGQDNAYKVTLSNRSAKAGQTVTADAIKIGGGMGNIARRISEEGATDNLKSSDKTANSSDETKQTKTTHQSPYTAIYQESGYPRFCEAARYWMQWAGIPDSVYSESQGKNDYTDDYKSRAIWVNYLAGGSAANPTERGLNIPVDMAFAFHSDAGTTLNDSIIGTLGIYQTDSYKGVFANGASRYLSHDLTDLIQSNIVRDIRTLYEPQWTRRGKWNQSYYEARVPQVPTMLLELLSHQNFADMRYGLDPRFRFTVSRAIYKGMLQFLCSQYRTNYIVQPLPVDHMALRMISENEIELTWQAVADPLEPTANAEKYIVYTRTGNGDFDNGVVVDKNSYRTTLPAGVVCSYKVTALNKGGESFPSEILSAGKAFNSKGTVLVVNGFDRISAPLSMRRDSLAGFYTELDGGVPDKQDISFIGGQQVFDLAMAGCEVDSIALGACNCDYETEVIGGNTFDYPYVHGRSIARAGYSFCSASVRAVGDRGVSLEEYSAVDLILGKQRSVTIGRGVAGYAFKTFSPELQDVLRRYMAGDGALFVSGSYVATDLWTGGEATPADRAFAEEVLHYTYDGDQAADRNRVRVVTSHAGFSRDEYRYVDDFRPDRYRVERVDALRPAGGGAFPVMRYVDNNRCAGVACADSRTFVMGFPFEALESDVQRDRLMADILGFLLGGKSGGDD